MAATRPTTVEYQIACALSLRRSEKMTLNICGATTGITTCTKPILEGLWLVLACYIAKGHLKTRLIAIYLVVRLLLVVTTFVLI